jgi:hypothetical protein
MSDERRIGNHKNLEPTIRNLLWWAFASLVAIVTLGNDALLGLAAASVGGIIFGILLFVK